MRFKLYKDVEPFNVSDLLKAIAEAVSFYNERGIVADVVEISPFWEQKISEYTKIKFQLEDGPFNCYNYSLEGLKPMPNEELHIDIIKVFAPNPHGFNVSGLILVAD